MGGVISYDSENSPFITKIAMLTRRGMTDRQIGRLLCKHYKTIAYHRRKNGIPSGRSYKSALTERRRAQAVHKRTYKMPYGGVAANEIPRQPKSKIKHGLNAYAPIICKGHGCPYRETCDMSESDLIVGEPCVAETAVITKLFEQYHREFQNEGDTDGLTRIRHLAEIEIKLMRCNRIMAMNPELVHTIWEDEQPVRKINPIAHYDLLLMRERHKVLSGLL